MLKALGTLKRGLTVGCPDYNELVTSTIGLAMGVVR